MTRAYLRLDPHFADRKAAYPDGAFRAFVDVLCFAEQQADRGRFRNEKLLRVLMERRARWLPFLIEHGDLTVEPDGRLYVDGWDEWQEGDFKVADRMAQVYGRRGETYQPSRGAIRQAQYRERTKVFERDDYTCRYCGNGQYPREWLVLEHVDPNGPSTDDNLVTACRPCNKLKGPRTPEEAGMVLRDVTVTRDGHSDTSQPSSGGVSGSGELKAEAVGGAPLPNGGAPPVFLGFPPKKPRKLTAKEVESFRRYARESRDTAIVANARETLEKAGIPLEESA